MKPIMFLLLIIFTSSSCAQKAFVHLSKKIEKSCTGVKGKWKGITFHELRTRLYNEGRLNFINFDSDTLYILESYEIEDGTYLGRIWNKKNVLNYTYYRSNFSFGQQKLFTDYTIQLIQKWDTATIEREDRTNASNLPEKYINATRVIITNTKAKIECTKFKEFFVLERDR